jgi:hypothetical protein
MSPQLHCKVPLEDNRRCDSSRASSNRGPRWSGNKPSRVTTRSCARRHFANEGTARESKRQNYR